MSAAVTNDLSIIYNGFTVGGTSDFLIIGPWKLEWGVTKDGSFRKAVVECTVLVTGTPYATFVTNRQALESAFSQSKARLQVLLGGATHIDANPATNSGFNHLPSARDLGDEWATGSSRAYLVRVECDLPSNLPNALADFQAGFDATPGGRRRVILTGTYTASGSTSALTQYETKIQAQADSFLNGLPASPITGNAGTANFELVEDKPDTDYQNTICTFRRVYLETIVAQAVGAFNDPDIVQPVISVDVRDSGPGDSVGPNPTYSQLPKDLGPTAGLAKRATEIVITYEAWITNTNNLQSRWASKIRPLLYQHLAAYGAGQLAVLEEAPRFILDDNRITATIRAIAFKSKLLELEIVVEDNQDFGFAVDPTWGDAYDADVAPGPARFMRVITRTSRTVGPVGLFDEIGLTNPPPPTTDGWVSLGRKRRPKIRKVGLLSSGKQAFVTDTVDVELLRYVKPPKGSANPNRGTTGSGAGANSTPPSQAPGASGGGSSSPTPGAPVATGSSGP